MCHLVADERSAADGRLENGAVAFCPRRAHCVGEDNDKPDVLGSVDPRLVDCILNHVPSRRVGGYEGAVGDRQRGPVIEGCAVERARSVRRLPPELPDGI